MDDDRIAEPIREEVTTPTRSAGTCCCRRPYVPDGGGESNHRCPVGKRNLCQECVTADSYNCRTHHVKTEW
jgi:hypothetical protein